MLNNNPVLQKIYEIAERYTKKYAGDNMSQAHILLATIILCNTNSLDLTASDEYNNAMNNFATDVEFFNKTVTLAFDFLK